MLIMMAPYRKSVPLQLAFHKGPFKPPAIYHLYSMNDIHEASSDFKTIVYVDDTNLISTLFSNSASAKT